MLGNRNVAARVLCLGLPLVWRTSVMANRRGVRVSLSGVVAITIAAIVLSRSRGAWLVTTLLIVALPVTSWMLSHPPHRKYYWNATANWMSGAMIGIVAGLMLPNRMGWTPADIQSSAQRVFEYAAGTG